MWCNLCAKYKKEISALLKGVSLASALAMANGTNYLSKHSASLNNINHFPRCAFYSVSYLELHCYSFSLQESNYERHFFL